MKVGEEEAQGAYKSPIWSTSEACEEYRKKLLQRVAAVGSHEKGPSSCTIENSVKKCWANAGRGDLEEIRSPNYQ